MRLPSKKRILSFLLVLPLLIVALLNGNGFCWQQNRFLLDQELIDAAIKYRLRYHRADGPFPKIYQSAEDVKAQNPGCCALKRQENVRSEFPQIFSSMLGMYASTVEITYRIADAGTEPFYKASVIIDCCGRVRGFYGSPQKSGPKL